MKRGYNYIKYELITEFMHVLPLASLSTHEKLAQIAIF